MLDNLYRHAESIYLRKACMKTDPVSLSPPLCHTYNIERIDFIVHPKLISEYETTKEYFRQCKIPQNEKLLFHGTHATNLNKILNNNFEVSADPVSRKKYNMYGKGIYFSDFPQQS